MPAESTVFNATNATNALTGAIVVAIGIRIDRQITDRTYTYVCPVESGQSQSDLFNRLYAANASITGETNDTDN